MRRTAWQILAGSAMSFTLAALIPAIPLAGVRGMLVVLPIVAALFASVSRAAGGPGTRSSSHFETALWAGWVLLALGHLSLGISGSSALVAASGLLLAGTRTLTLALRLRRRIAQPVLWPFFALPLALYLFAWPWTTTARAPDGDEPYYLLLTHSLSEDLDVDLADEYRDQAWRSFTTVPVAPQPGDPTGAQGEIFSRHSALLPFALAPLYLLAGPFGAQLGMLAFAAAAAAAGLAAARSCYPSRPRGLLAAWMVLAFSPPLLLYAGQFWVEVPAALLVALICRSLVRLDPARRGATATLARLTRGELLALALPLAALPLLKLRFLAIALPLGALAAFRLRGSGRRRYELLGLAGAAILALGLWNAWRFGNPLRMYAGGDLAIFNVPLTDHLRGNLGLFFDLAYGLFALSPIWLLLLPGLLAVFWHRRHRATGRASGSASGRPPAALAPIPELAVLLPYLLLIGMRREWYGGWSPPFRYGVVLLPALALLLPPLFARRQPAFGLRWLCATLATLSAGVALAYLVHPAWAYSLADGSSRLLDELSRGTGVDFGRFFPSMVRLRPATWIVPLLLTLAVVATAWRGVAGRSLPVGKSGRRLAWPSAVLFLLLVWGGGVMAAQRLPTSRIEFEDTWLAHRGGALFPERWTVDRTRFDGGWALRPGTGLAARPVAGGDFCRLTIRLASFSQPPDRLALEIRAGARLVETVEVPQPEDRGSRFEDLGWTTLATTWFPLTSGESLNLRTIGSAGDSTPGFVVLDHAVVDWR